MSCSVQIKTRNPVKSKKVNNVIHRTTSETIRLGEPDVLLNNSSRQVITAISPPPLKKSTCSFQITGVSVTQRTDFGDDSADDLDESHTDDISRVTDNETPSFSEDTCSREVEENYIASCSAVCSVTVIPTSSQYGLAILPLDTSTGSVSEGSNPSTSKASETNSKLTMTETPNSPTSEVAVTTSARFPGTRFKIVKVETSKPFRRGRWWCMDYLDQSPYTPKNALTYKSPVSPITCPQLQYTMTATTTQAQPFQVNTESGTKYANPNFTAQTQSAETTVVTQCVSSIAQSKMYQQPADFSVKNSVSQFQSVVAKNARLTSEGCTSTETSIIPSIIQQSYAVPLQSQINQTYATNKSNIAPIIHSQQYSAPTQPVPTFSTMQITGSVHTQPGQAAAIQNMAQTKLHSYHSIQDMQLPNITAHSISPHLYVGNKSTSAQNYSVLPTSIIRQQEAVFVTGSQSQQIPPEQSSRPLLLHQPISLQFEYPENKMFPLHGCSMPAHMLNISSQNLPTYNTSQVSLHTPQSQVPTYAVSVQDQTPSKQNYSDYVLKNQVSLEQASETTNDNDKNKKIRQNQIYSSEVQTANIERSQTVLSDLTLPHDVSESAHSLDDSPSSVLNSHSSISQSSSDALAPAVSAIVSVPFITQGVASKEIEDASPDSAITGFSSIASKISIDSASDSKVTSMDSASLLGIASTGIKRTTTQVCSVASQTGPTPTSSDLTFSAAVSTIVTTSVTSTVYVAPSVSAASTIFTTSGVPILPIVPPRLNIFDDVSVMKVSQAINELSAIAASADVPHTHAANNTSAIIDTKIEQAMDLVKSHLMYTVREEVEVLKERITVLLDRINQLETENNFLKANAAPEVLIALNNRAPGAQTQGNNPSTSGAEGGAPSN